MSSPFKIQKAEIFPGDHTYVSWTHDASKFVYQYIITDIVFGLLKCNEVGFGVKLNNNEIDTLWLHIDEWHQDKTKNYSHHLQETYVIMGIIFKDHEKAVQFYEWLEKKYMWEALSV